MAATAHMSHDKARRKLRVPVPQACALFIGLIASLISVDALTADPPQMRLAYQVPLTVAGCPREQSFRDMVAGRLGFDPFEANASELIHVEITTDAKALRGRVKWLGDKQNLIGES